MFLILCWSGGTCESTFSRYRDLPEELRYDNFVCMGSKGIFFFKTEILDVARELVI